MDRIDAPSPCDQSEWIDYQEDLLMLESQEEYNRDQLYTEWPIATMVHRKVAVTGLAYVGSHFIWHGCREVVFRIPRINRPSYGPKRQTRPAFVNVRDTLRVQDFVSIRRKESPDSLKFTETMLVSPAIVSRISNGEIAVRLKEDVESTYTISQLQDGIIVKLVIDDTTHRRIKRALTMLQLGLCPEVSSNIRDLIFAEGDHSRQKGDDFDVVCKRLEEITLRNESLLGEDKVRTKVLSLAAAQADSVADPVDSEGLLILPKVDFFNKQLDASQKEAVEFALKQPTLAIIHGPPGTGKTTTLVEVIHQLVLRHRKRVLVCGPSNVSVDNLLKKLYDPRLLRDDCMVRMGNPGRVFDSQLMEMTLDGQLNRFDTNKILQYLRSLVDIEPDPVLKAQIAARLRHQKQKLAKPLLTKANIVLATLASACPHETMLKTIISVKDVELSLKDAKHQDKSLYFDVVIIDECGQSTEMATYIPLWLGKKAILAGDHLQLPPTVLSGEANDRGMGISLMQRLVNTARGQGLTRMLTVQYRMNKLIMDLVSDLLYDGKLIAHQSVSSHLMKELCPKMSHIEYPAIAYINTVGQTRGREEREPATNSLSNDLEAEIILNYAKRMTIEFNIDLGCIGVITPYQDQIRVIQEKLASRGLDAIEVNTVDGFQGREKEVILISFVRSNDRGNIGFLKEKRRLNVAITRARRHVLFVGNFGTLIHDEFIQSLFVKVQEDGKMLLCSKYMSADPRSLKPKSAVRNVPKSERIA